MDPTEQTLHKYVFRFILHTLILSCVVAETIAQTPEVLET